MATRVTLYIITVVLLLGWAVGHYTYHQNGCIYIMLGIAIATFIMGITEPTWRCDEDDEEYEGYENFNKPK